MIDLRSVLVGGPSDLFHVTSKKLFFKKPVEIYIYAVET